MYLADQDQDFYFVRLPWDDYFFTEPAADQEELKETE
jgi:hypothetical protein